MDANKILDTLAARFANKNAQMEKEISLLLVKNEDLKQENEKLQKQLNGVVGGAGEVVEQQDKVNDTH